MNKNDFLSLIGSKSPVDRQVLTEISELVNIFPYFQTAHLLLLKGLKDNADIRFENQLRNSAIYIADREVLYNLLKVPLDLFENEALQEPKDEIPLEKAPIKEALMEESPKEVALMEELPKEEALLEELPMEKPLMAEHLKEEALIEEPYKEEPPKEEALKEEPLKEEPLKEAIISGDLEQTVIESARNSEDLIYEIEKSAREESFEEKIKNEDKTLSRSILVSVESDIDEPERSVLIINDETADNEENIFYMDPGFSIPESEPEFIPESESLPEQQPADEPVAVTKATSGEDLKNLNKKTQADLIDKFISASPKIEPKKERLELPAEDLAEKFTEEKGGFVTETLARIYVSQEYYSKAIDIYEKLCLKFPEKSGYFTAQIEKIKAIIK